MGESNFDRCMVAVFMPILIAMIIGIYMAFGVAAYNLVLWVLP